MRLRGKAGALELEQLLDSGPWRLLRVAEGLVGAAGGLQGAREGVSECASALREHEEGEPERGHANHATVAPHCTNKFRNAGALRARERQGPDAIYGLLHAMGRMGEGGALPSSPKDTEKPMETSCR